MAIRLGKPAAAVLALGAVVAIGLAARYAYPRAVVRWHVSELASADAAVSLRGFTALQQLGRARVRADAVSLCQALERCASPNPATTSADWDDVQVWLREAARRDPRAVCDARRRVELAPYAFFALLEAERADLADPETHEAELVTGIRTAPGDRVSFWPLPTGGSRGPFGDLWLEGYEHADTLAVYDGHLAVLGDVPLEAVRPPERAHWYTEAPVARDRTYAARLRIPDSSLDEDVFLTIAIRIVEYLEGDHVRIRWRLVESRRGG